MTFWVARGVTRNLVAYLPEERTGDMLTKDGVPDLARVCPTNAAKRCHVKKVPPPPIGNGDLVSQM